MKKHFGDLFLAMLALGALLCPILADASAPKSGGPAGTLRFSPQPTVPEISDARVFDEPLLPMGVEPGEEENKALADALANYSYRTNLDDFSSLTGFLSRFRESTWSGSLLLHLGIEYYNYGYYSKALDAWEQAWKQCENVDDSKAKTQADRALGNLAGMYSRLGRMRELSGASEDRVRTCFAVGLTLTVVTVLDLPNRRGDLRWGAKLLASGAPA